MTAPAPTHILEIVASARTRQEAAAALGIGESTLRRWLARIRAGEPIRYERGRPKAIAPPCSVPRCGRPARARGLCQAHYRRKKRAEESRG